MAFTITADLLEGNMVIIILHLLLGVGYAAVLIVYCLTLHPLARFHGPKTAAATKWYQPYYDCVKGGGGLSSYEVDRMHERYSTVQSWELTAI